jgi:hypothetical protein
MRMMLVLCCLTFFMAVHPAVEIAYGQDNEPPDSSADIPKLILRRAPQPNCDGPVPSKITGRVLAQSGNDTSGVEGVSVTDVYSVVKTDALGDYTLKPDPHAVFVYITRPAGFDIAGDWYKSLAATVILNSGRQNRAKTSTSLFTLRTLISHRIVSHCLD